MRSQAKRTKAKYNPLWEGTHDTTKAKLYITIKKDHFELLVLYESSKIILSHRLDQCGVHYQYNGHTCGSTHASILPRPSRGVLKHAKLQATSFECASAA
jgi:hypothetical protein